MFGLVVFVQNISRYFVGTLKERERERWHATLLVPQMPCHWKQFLPQSWWWCLLFFVVGAVIVVVVAAAPTVVVPGLYSRSF